ncbi:MULTISPECIES: alkaline phosphatase family protein [unclassified Coleofasciculus]|uniref:alkaline phosphatase family protein n=1 Tax=unclassified Coleofasciculus TaxID=2692782 RepID=UPI00187FED89|nr:MULTISPECIES: alkaline phosphatase family protein [unclassified Coleofasciculus]MBE9126810.1 alkaline phosphatase family protein [Coleofasciculus sp. LEGE 07081]MBE9150181.1 alkaline phosphatase family protein [Coleofasciculus sp. LEGE 07092]
MTTKKLLFIGLDSAEPELLKQWSQEGSLPNLQNIWTRSIWGNVQIPKGFSNGAMWPSLFTGVDPSKHVRYNYLSIEPGTYNFKHQFHEDTDYQALPFWVELSKQGKRVGIVDVPRAPLTRDINGFQIADWLTHDRRDAIPRSYPESLAQSVIETFGEDEIGERPELYLHNHSLQSFIDLMKKRIAVRAEQTIQLAKQSDYDLFMTVFGEPHDVGHMCWHLHDCTHEDYDSSFGDPVKEVYVALDQAIGKIINNLDYTEVILFAGPGMTKNYAANEGFDHILQKIEQNYIKQSKLTKKRHQSLIPQVRTLLRKYLPKQVRSKIYDQIPEAVKKQEKKVLASQQRLFTLPFGNTGCAIRLNVVDREPHGLIKRGQEYNEICDFLRHSLSTVKNIETGTPLVEEVIQVNQLYQGQALDRLPDLVVLWNRDYPIRQVGSEELGQFEVKCYTRRSGEHNESALFWLNSSSLTARKLEITIKVEDLAPTIGLLLDAPLKETDGSPIQEILGKN